MSRRFSHSRGASGFNRGRGKRSNGFISPTAKPLWDSEDLIPFQKNFYREHSAVTNRSPSQLEEFMKSCRMSFENTNIKPIMSFPEICFPPPIMSVLAQMNFESPTPIQAASWPILLSGSDLVGIAQTGSGKTLAYLLPSIVQAESQFHAQPGDGPIILVLAPTRELAQQIQSVANDFSRVSRCRYCCIYGGASKRTQLQEYKKGAELVIATPGRLIDFINSCEVSLHRVTYLVLDEADRMLDMGFEPQIRKIIDQIRPDRQTCMFSATWPHEVRRLASDFLSQAAYVTIGDRELSANHNITQIVEICSEREKDFKIRSVLLEILKERNSKTIVFAQTKQRVRQYFKMLSHMGLPVLDIHGDKKQMERDRTLKQFREMRRAILIATDVASRGLDVEDVKFVINIDYPAQTEDYIHRIGRTARSNHHGTSYTFFTIKNKREAPKLIKVLREAGQPIPDKLAEMGNYVGVTGRSGGGSRRPASDYDRAASGGGSYSCGVGEDDRRGGYERKRSRFDMDYNNDNGRPRKYPTSSNSAFDTDSGHGSGLTTGDGYSYGGTSSYYQNQQTSSNTSNYTDWQHRSSSQYNHNPSSSSNQGYSSQPSSISSSANWNLMTPYGVRMPPALNMSPSGAASMQQPPVWNSIVAASMYNTAANNVARHLPATAIAAAANMSTSGSNWPSMIPSGAVGSNYNNMGASDGYTSGNPALGQY